MNPTKTDSRAAIGPVHKLVARIGHMSTSELQLLVGALEGRAVTSRNRSYLARRAAWLVQARKGPLGDATRARLEALARDALPRQRPPARRKAKGDLASPLGEFARRRDPRLPRAGTTIKRTFAGKNFEVEVLERGFMFRGEFFTSLSTIATRATGKKWNGFVFWGLKRRSGKPKAA